MTITHFDRKRDLIIVNARVWGAHGDFKLSLVLDTGSTETVVTPELVEQLGYQPRDGEAITTVRSAIGEQQGYTLRVKQFSALGFAVPDYRVHVFELAIGRDIDGLIGLSFLDRLDYTVRSHRGPILADPTAD